MLPRQNSASNFQQQKVAESSLFIICCRELDNFLNNNSKCTQYVYHQEGMLLLISLTGTL